MPHELVIDGRDEREARRRGGTENLDEASLDWAVEGSALRFKNAREVGFGFVTEVDVAHHPAI